MDNISKSTRKVIVSLSEVCYTSFITQYFKLISNINFIKLKFGYQSPQSITSTGWSLSLTLCLDLLVCRHEHHMNHNKHILHDCKYNKQYTKLLFDIHTFFLYSLKLTFVVLGDVILSANNIGISLT